MRDRGSQRLAILVACHDDGETIAQTIDSLRAEPDAEMVVVDDGSTDAKTLRALDGLEQSGIRVLRQENAGPSAAWMAGLGATSALYVMPFSSDDLLVPGSTGRLAAALDANPGAAAAWGDFETFGAAAAYIATAPALCPWLLTYVNVYPGIALFRREALLAVGGWQLTTGIEDWDLWMRLAEGGFSGVHVPGASFRYRRDAGGRFRGRVGGFDPFYDELQRRHAQLFEARAANREASPAPRALKLLFPVIERLPFASRLLKVQLCDAFSLLFWRAGTRQTARVVAQGLLFRIRLVSRRGSGARARG
jgi:glycosyltransferase involved in cell wall biosynthesis